MLVGALREAILSGRLVSGTRLPSSRLLATQLRIARGTVVAAYEELVSEGYCEARVGAGTFVAITSRLFGSTSDRVSPRKDFLTRRLRGRCAAPPNGSRRQREPVIRPAVFGCVGRWCITWAGPAGFAPTRNR
jgi:GntR family transcriptional regulator/MocR family aminotransferase